MDRLAYFCLWLFTFTVPWEASVAIPGLGTGPKGVGTIGKLVGLAAAAIGVLAVLARGRARPLAVFHILAGCFVIWVGLSSAWAITPAYSVLAFKVAIQVAAIPWLVWEFAVTPHRRRLLLQAFVLGSYISAINILVNYRASLATDAKVTTEVAGRFTAEGFNPNAIGFLLSLALPIAWYLSLNHRSAVLAWLNRLYLPLGTVAILLTGSRSSLIGAMLGLCLVPLTLNRVSLWMRGAVISLITVTLLAGAIIVPARTLERLGTTKDEIESGTLNERRVIWHAGYEVFQRHPFRGIGAGGFADAVEPFLGYPKTAHNTYVSVLVEEGLVGLAILILMLVSLYFHARSAPPEERRLLYVLIVSLTIGMLPRAVEFDKPLWLMFGLLLTPPGRVLVAQASRAWVPYRGARPPARPVPPVAVR